MARASESMRLSVWNCFTPSHTLSVTRVFISFRKSVRGRAMSGSCFVMGGLCRLLGGVARFFGEQVGPGLTEKHQPRLGNTVCAPLGNRLCGNPAHRGNRAGPSKRINDFCVFHTIIKACFTYFCQGRLSIFAVAFIYE